MTKTCEFLTNFSHRTQNNANDRRGQNYPYFVNHNKYILYRPLS